MKTNYFGHEITVCERTALYGGSFNYDLTVYEPEKVMNMAEHLKGLYKPVLLDIGASTGSYSLLPLLVPELEVHSFEPCADVCATLKRNISKNKVQGVTVNNYAVSNYVGTGNFNMVIDASQKALSILDGRPADHKRVKTIPMRTTTIDFYCDVYEVIPTAIKIDTEGNELNVLKGGLSVIDQYHPIIQCEFSQENANQYGYDIYDIVKLLSQFNYKIKIENADLFAV